MCRAAEVLLLCAGCVLPLGVSACGSSGNPDFGLTVQTAAVTVHRGATATASIAVTPVSHSEGSITLTLSGLPGNVGVAPAVATVGIGSTQTFVLAAANNAVLSASGQPSTITVTGNSQNVHLSNPIEHDATFTLAVVP